MRCFVSIDLPADLVDELEAVQADLEPASGIRLTDPSQAHVTLKFLGEVSPSAVDGIVDGLQAAVRRADQPPFEATIAGLGAFPDRSYINVVWVGVTDGTEAMTAIAEAVETELVGHGFDPADHAFTPHVTIARMDHAGGKERIQRLLDTADPVIGRLSVDSIALTESTLTDAGPRYETIERISLPNSGR